MLIIIINHIFCSYFFFQLFISQAVKRLPLLSIHLRLSNTNVKLFQRFHWRLTLFFSSLFFFLFLNKIYVSFSIITLILTECFYFGLVWFFSNGNFFWKCVCVLFLILHFIYNVVFMRFIERFTFEWGGIKL